MKVSVIIPTFNRAGQVLRAIDSALAQTYRELDVIVVDDGSMDATQQVLKGVADYVTIIRQTNAGPSAARNRGVAAAKGEVIAFLDSDDIWLRDKIQRQVDLMSRAGPRMCCCVCNATVLGEDGQMAGRTFDFAGIRPGFGEGEWLNPQDILSTRFLLFNQVVAIRRDSFERVGGFNEGLRLLEDYELAIKLSAAGTWGIIRDPLVIKYNDTRGIGVECMMDRDWHTRVRTAVIRGILESAPNLGRRARMNLERFLADLHSEARALALLKHGGIPVRAYGRAMELWMQVRRIVRRHSPGWPQFEGRPLDGAPPLAMSGRLSDNIIGTDI